MICLREVAIIGARVATVTMSAELIRKLSLQACNIIPILKAYTKASLYNTQGTDGGHGSLEQ